MIASLRLLVVFGALGGCAREKAKPKGIEDASSPVEVQEGGASNVGRATPSGEARRSDVTRLGDVPGVGDNLAALEKHFGQDRGPFVVQQMDLPLERRALLVERKGPPERPILMVLTEQGERLFTFEHPTGGLIEPTRHVNLTLHTSGGPGLFFLNAPTGLVGGRFWAEDHHPFSDFEVMRSEACESLSVAFWPGQGWLVVAGEGDVLRLQLIREGGQVAFSGAGLPHHLKWRVRGAPTILVADPRAVVVLGIAEVLGRDHLVALRFDPRGRMLWPEPVDLGEVPKGSMARGKVDARADGSGGVQIPLPGGLAGSRAKGITLDGAGGIHRW